MLVEYEEELINAKREIAREVTQEVTQKVTQKVTREVARETASETALEIARNLLTQGLSPENIAKATKLPIESIKELQFQLMPV